MKYRDALEIVNPESVGISSLAVETCLRNLDQTENEIHGFVAARHGKVFGESYLSPYAVDIPHTCHSLGKSYTCTAVGIAMTEGLLNAECLIVDLFAEEIRQFGAIPDANMRKIRLRDVMSMSNGMESMPEMNEFWLENYLKSPVKYEPGTRFLYNSVGSCLLGAAVEKVTGKSVYDYLSEKLFPFIGIDENDLVWLKFANGYCAEPGICATTRVNLKLGLFYLNQGMADGRQIVSREWIAEATSKQIDTSTQPGTDDGSMGYGWQLWLNRLPGAYRFDGGQGQFCVVYPQKQMVIAIHEGGKHPYGVQKVLDIVHQLMEEADDERLPENLAAYAQLKNYSQTRAVANAEPSDVPQGAEDICGTYWVHDGIFNPWIEVSPGPVDFYHLFYDPWINASVQKIDISLKDGRIEIVMNSRAKISAALDGQWSQQETDSVMPPLRHYAATARFEGPDKLHVSLRWLNGWCCPEIWFTRCGDCDLLIRVEKDMLHEGRPPFTNTAKARKTR